MARASENNFKKLAYGRNNVIITLTSEKLFIAKNKQLFAKQKFLNAF